MATRRQYIRGLSLKILVLAPVFMVQFLSTEGRSSIHIKKVIVVEYFENCDQKTYPIMCVNFTFARNGTAVVVSGNEIIDRDSKDQMSVQYRIEKCKDKSNPDTCEYYNTWKWDNICSVMNVMPFFKRFLESHTPPLFCPFKKNHYSFRDASVETNLVAQFLSRGDSNRVLSKFHTVLLERGETFTCVDFAFKIANIRVKQ